VCVDYLTQVALAGCQEAIRERDELRRKLNEANARLATLERALRAEQATVRILLRGHPLGIGNSELGTRQ
jgi:hypothetical protein